MQQANQHVQSAQQARRAQMFLHQVLKKWLVPIVQQAGPSQLQARLYA
jgi:hypothetical protein